MSTVVPPALPHVRQSQHHVLHHDLYQCLLVAPDCAALDRDAIHTYCAACPSVSTVDPNACIKV